MFEALPGCWKCAVATIFFTNCKWGTFHKAPCYSIFQTRWTTGKKNDSRHGSRQNTISCTSLAVLGCCSCGACCTPCSYRCGAGAGTVLRCCCCCWCCCCCCCCCYCLCLGWCRCCCNMAADDHDPPGSLPEWLCTISFPCCRVVVTCWVIAVWCTVSFPKACRHYYVLDQGKNTNRILYSMPAYG